MVRIVAISPGSIAEELGLSGGDALLAVNGEPVRDLIDFHLSEAGENLLLDVLRADGERWDLELEKDAEEPLGLELEHPEPTQCGNNCLFCFVHQLPRGMRPTLYVKDEDYRFSYLYGAYVTLTNIDEAQVSRILSQKLSPLYVSVHATEPQLRSRLLGLESPPVLDILRRLVEGGIEIHTQVVLCPGINDGAELMRTIDDLYELHPGVRTLAVVPVGLTGYRKRLPALRVPSEEEARELIDLLHARQGDFLERGGSRFVFAADELYLRARLPFPPEEEYESFDQLENGVGLIPLFRSEAQDALLEARPLKAPPVSLVTGESFAKELGVFALRLQEKTGVPIAVHSVSNDFFGGDVTVTGLLTGRDILAQLKGKDLGGVLLLPDVLLRQGEEVLLDDLTPVDLERELGLPVRIVDSSPWGLLEGLESLENLNRAPLDGPV